MTFFENTKTPKSIADCVAIDPTAGSLSAWATRLKLIAKIVFFLFAGVCGFLLFVSLIVFFDDEEMAGIIAITAGSIIASGFLEYSILWTLATLIQALACLVQNTKVSAMVAIYKTGEELPEPTVTKVQPTLSSNSSPISEPKNDPPQPAMCALCGKTDVPLTRQRIYGTGGWGDVCEECAKNL